MIKSVINKKIGDALKSGDEIRLSVLRMLSSALNYEYIAKQHELSEEEEIVVVRREIKKRNDAVDSYKKVQVNDPVNVQKKIDRELSEIKILKEFLPPEISDEELRKIVEEVVMQFGATSIKEMGKVIGAVRAKVGVSAEGGKIAQIVKEILTAC